MLLKNIFFILLINQSISYKFLNKHIPFCTNCIHFIEDKTNYPYDPIPNNDKNGKCKLFGTVNLLLEILIMNMHQYVVKIKLIYVV